MSVRRLFTRVALAVIVAVAACVLLPGSKPVPLPERGGAPLRGVQSWGYQLQGARAELIPPGIDLVVIDHARDAGGSDLLSVADVQAYQTRPSGKPRIILAYMSIGEAETYRYYWWTPWVSQAYLGFFRPRWLARENKDWKGNYLVRFWESGWQKIILNPTPSIADTLRHTWLGAPQPYIDQLLEAGFDGVYLDRVDVFGEWEKTRPTAEADMSAFVQRISAYAKARKPGFLVIAQNGEELVSRHDYRAAIDGLAKEDLLFGVEQGERANDRDETKRSTELLRNVSRDGKPVFVVEYLRDATKRQIAAKRISDLGFIGTFADRELNRPPELVLPQPPILDAPAAASIPLTPAIPKPQP